MTCEQCTENLTEFLEGGLSRDAEREMQAHLEACAECARALARTRALVATLRGLPEVDPPAGLREQLREIPVGGEARTQGWWPRSRRVVATFTAAAAAVLLVGTGVFFYQRETGRPMEPTIVAERAAPSDAPAQMEAATAADEAADPAAERIADAPAGVEQPAVTETPAREETPVAATAPTGALVRGEAGGRSDRAASSPPARRVQPPREREERIADAAPSMRVAPPPSGAEPSARPPAEPSRDSEKMMGTTSAEGMVATEGIIPAAPQGPAGPAGPSASRPMVAEADRMAPTSDPLVLPAPMYLDAGAGAATTRVGEGTPFTVGVTPPHEKVIGTVVAGTIRLETEADVSRARVTVAGSEDLELVGLGEDGVVFEGPLTAGQQTVLSVRMLARRVGSQSISMRVRSTDPIVDTQLDVGMGEFVEPVPPARRLVRFNFVGTPIREAVSELSRQSGMSVIVDPGVGDATVTARAEDLIPAAGALRAIAEAAGLQVTERDGTLVVERTGSRQ
ncbi:MAG: zf-HC2 domain-containing protein [Armatimonadota bacterium]